MFWQKCFCLKRKATFLSIFLLNIQIGYYLRRHGSQTILEVTRGGSFSASHVVSEINSVISWKYLLVDAKIFSGSRVSSPMCHLLDCFPQRFNVTVEGSNVLAVESTETQKQFYDLSGCRISGKIHQDHNSQMLLCCIFSCIRFNR